MTMIQLIACIGMIAGLFMVLHVSPRELSDSLFARLTAAPGSIRADIQHFMSQFLEICHNLHLHIHGCMVICYYNFHLNLHSPPPKACPAAFPAGGNTLPGRMFYVFFCTYDSTIKRLSQVCA